jgi:hypothetical protein
MNKIFGIATKVATPLSLGGFIAAAFFFVVRQIIAKNIFPTLSQGQGGVILLVVIDKFFILALVALVLGFLGYVIQQFKPTPPLPAPPLKQSIVLSIPTGWTFEQAVRGIVEVSQLGRAQFDGFEAADLTVKLPATNIDSSTVEDALKQLYSPQLRVFHVEYADGVFHVHP